MDDEIVIELADDMKLEDEFERITGKKFDPEKYEVSTYGADGYGYDSLITTYRIKEKQITNTPEAKEEVGLTQEELDKYYKSLVENTLGLVRLSEYEPKDEYEKRQYNEELERRKKEQAEAMEKLPVEMRDKAGEEVKSILAGKKETINNEPKTAEDVITGETVEEEINNNNNNNNNNTNTGPSQSELDRAYRNIVDQTVRMFSTPVPADNIQQGLYDRAMQRYKDDIEKDIELLRRYAPDMFERAKEEIKRTLKDIYNIDIEFDSNDNIKNNANSNTNNNNANNNTNSNTNNNSVNNNTNGNANNNNSNNNTNGNANNNSANNNTNSGVSIPDGWATPMDTDWDMLVPQNAPTNTNNNANNNNANNNNANNNNANNNNANNNNANNNANANANAPAAPTVTVVFRNGPFPIPNYGNIQVAPGTVIHGPLIDPVPLNKNGKPKRFTAKTFECWEDQNGNEVDLTQPITQDIELHPRFKFDVKKAAAVGAGALVGCLAYAADLAIPSPIPVVSQLGTYGFGIGAFVSKKRLTNLQRQNEASASTISAVDAVPADLADDIARAKKNGYISTFLKTAAIACGISSAAHGIRNRRAQREAALKAQQNADPTLKPDTQPQIDQTIQQNPDPVTIKNTHVQPTHHTVTTTNEVLGEFTPDGHQVFRSASDALNGTNGLTPYTPAFDGVETFQAYNQVTGMRIPIHEGQSIADIISGVGASNINDVAVNVMNSNGVPLSWQPLGELVETVTTTKVI